MNCRSDGSKSPVGRLDMGRPIDLVRVAVVAFCDDLDAMIKKVEDQRL